MRTAQFHQGSVEPPERLTLWVCSRGHVARGTLDGVCWACFPGGKRTWEPGMPKQTEPNQRQFVYALVGPTEDDPEGGKDRSDEIRWRIAHAERTDLRSIGDLLQSESSRLAEWAKAAMQSHPTTLEMPYEVRQALIGVETAVLDWTQARTFKWADMVREQMDAEASASDEER